jgi:Holliday junction resolvase
VAVSSGRRSRRKGANGEREVRDLIRRFGFAAVRDGRFDGDINHDIPGTWVEVKRRETASVWAWFEQAQRDAGRRGLVPFVFFRRSKSPWLVLMPAEEALRLKRLEADADLQP